jgi:hypothetical protein
MKIKTDNHVKTNAALHAINGKPMSHTFTAGELDSRGCAITRHLLKHFSQKAMRGIVGYTYSSVPVARAYKYSRVGNRAEFVVNAKGEVFITSLGQVELQERDGGGTFFQFTDGQQKMIAKRAVTQASSL